MIEYPKIETLYNRSKETFAVIPGELRKPEFSIVSSWFYTEKIDGTNIRVYLQPDGEVRFFGRTDNAQIPPRLLNYLVNTFSSAKMQAAFEGDGETRPEVIFFGEGYGAGIQKGESYRPEPAFRLFDVMVGDMWLEWENIFDVALKLEIKTVPVIGHLDGHLFPQSEVDLAKIIQTSFVAREDGGNENAFAEGIVARPKFTLFDRRGNRIIWKLKFVDFKKGKK